MVPEHEVWLVIGDATIWRLVRKLSGMSCSLRSPSKIESLVRAYSVHPDLLPTFTILRSSAGLKYLGTLGTHVLYLR